MEWKNNFRADGLAMSIYNIIAVAMAGIALGIFNGLLAGSGYVAPYMDAAGNLVAAQTQVVQNVITFGFVGLETITGVILAILLLLLDVEKGIEYKQAEIKARMENAAQKDIH
ncbi:MAG: MFS transporter [Erysipelotrichaceae bacterium]|nr:MFS transporter [Erysipelotrichaceae bacterium]